MKNKYFELKVLREGFTTTIQDFGFKNLQHLGITSGGAIDDFSYQLGNIILSNKITTPSIEFTKFYLTRIIYERTNSNDTTNHSTRH